MPACRRGSSFALVTVLFVIVAGCHGGGGGDAQPPAAPAAPSNLSYPTTQNDVAGTAVSVSPTVTGTVTTDRISPPLPGLTLNPQTRTITGTPTLPTAAKSYTVTASNSAGSTSFTFTLAVLSPTGLWFELVTPSTAVSLTGPPPVNPSFPLAFAEVDLDADGVDEVIVGMGSATPDPAQPAPLRILAKGAGATLVDATDRFLAPPYPQFTHPRRIVAADFNGDGKRDLFVAAHGYDAAPFPGEPNALLLSRPDGKLASAPANIPPESEFTHSAAAGDVNGDARPDIYVGNISGGDPYLLLNNGLGVFAKGAGLLPAAVIS